MNFENYLSRLDERSVQDIIGKPAMRILNALNPELTRISRLQRVLLNIYSPVEFLKNKRVREEIIDSLKENEALVLCSLLGKRPGSDVFATLKALRFSATADWNALLQYFEIEPEPFEDEADFEPNRNVDVAYPLFSHQRRAIAELRDKLYEGEKKVMLHMPTGSGKTRTAMNVIAEHLRLQEPSMVLWLAHTEELCEQASSEFEKAWSFLGNRQINVLRYWGNSSENISELKDGFVVAGLNKIFNLLKSDAAAISKLAGHCTLVIMDEAHMAIAPTYKLNLQVLTGFNSSLLGLSATPGRTWNDPEIDKQLSGFFNNQKVALTVEGYSNPVDYLVEEGYLAEIDNRPLFYNGGAQISAHDLEYLQNNLQLSESVLKSMSEDQQRNILILQRIEELITRHKRIIVFAMNVKHSDLLAMCLQAREINAFSVTSNTDPTQRKKLIERYKSDEDIPLVLCNYGIFTTGFDAPETSCAVISRPTDSLVLYSQMVGRAIRGVKAGGNERAEIVTVVDSSLPGFDTVATAFYNWEDVW